MRIAVSGSHNTGKTTLIDELIGFLPRFSTVDEPYNQLAEEGHAFTEVPCLEDFEAQLERSIEAIMESEENCLFDRCPADILAYLTAHDDSEGLSVSRWLPRAREAMRRLALIVLVPIEDPDRVTLSASEHRRLRRRVDEELQDIVLQDRWDFDVPVIEVAGPPHERARQVLTYLGIDVDV